MPVRWQHSHVEGKKIPQKYLKCLSDACECVGSVGLLDGAGQVLLPPSSHLQALGTRSANKLPFGDNSVIANAY